MNELEINPLKERKVIDVARDKSSNEDLPVIAMELANGKIITGKKTEILSPASSLILNAVKELTKIPDDVDLLSKSVLEPILKLKPLGNHTSNSLNLEEVLIALSICSATNPIVKRALKNLNKLSGLEAHASFMVYNGDLNTLKRLNINLTCDPIFYSNNLFMSE